MRKIKYSVKSAFIRKLLFRSAYTGIHEHVCSAIENLKTTQMSSLLSIVEQSRECIIWPHHCRERNSAKFCLDAVIL